MGAPEAVTQGKWFRHMWLGALTLATSGALVADATRAFASSASGAQHARFESSNPHKHQTKQKGGGHPCLVGNWVVTSLTLSTTGLTFTGGVGTTVDIMSNGNALGNFTPGTPLRDRGLRQVQRHHHKPLRLLAEDDGKVGQLLVSHICH
jgi:hypothetical protein